MDRLAYELTVDPLRLGLRDASSEKVAELLTTPLPDCKFSRAQLLHLDVTADQVRLIRGELIPPPPPVRVDGKPNLLIVYDCPNWAYDRISRQLARYLTDFTVSRFSYRDFVERRHQVTRATFVGIEVAILLPFQAVCMVQQGLFPTYTKLITCQYDDFLWRDPRGQQLLRSAAVLSDAMLFANARLRDVVAAEIKLPPIVALCEDGVDTGMFAHHESHSFDSRQLRVGWAGNGDQSHLGDTKGLVELKESLSRIQRVDFVVADRSTEWRDHETIDRKSVV